MLMCTGPALSLKFSWNLFFSEGRTGTNFSNVDRSGSKWWTGTHFAKVDQSVKVSGH
ncbi:hypothetical protein LguiA_013532 [Lonicera macranthoides]